MLKSQAQDAKQLFVRAEQVKKTIELENNSEMIIKLNNILLSLPNILDNDVPDGDSESDNLEVKKHGKIKLFFYKPKTTF